MEKRAYTIDLLRGLAIIGMVLSGQILWHAELPSWLFHAQVPPPDFVFNPSVPGITWVDLVFPFFLFSMGAAMPLAMRRKANRGESTAKITVGVVTRWALLAMFAIALGNLRSGHLGEMPGWGKALIELAVWAMFCAMFIRVERLSSSRNAMLHAGGVVAIIAMMLLCRYALSLPVTIYRSDIIILVLSNMALFGSLVWWFTRDNLLARLGILALVVAMKISITVEGSWSAQLWAMSPAPWLFKAEFLKYLCIIIPGTIAGDAIYRWQAESNKDAGVQRNDSSQKASTMHIAAMAPLVMLFAVNMWGLFTRHLTINAIASVVLCIVAWQMLKRGGRTIDALRTKLFTWGIFWLLLGLTLEAYEGGIKKDPATLSYFFTTSGLALTLIVAASIAMERFGVRFSPIIKCGQNPMVAYTAAGFVIMPILMLTGLDTKLSDFAALTPWCGVVRGVAMTAAVMIFTILLTNKKIFWRT